MSTAKLRGIIPPVPTIVDDDGAFDPGGMATVLERNIASGVDGVLILGSGGEFCHMGIPLRKEVAAFAVRQTAGRVPVLVGIGACGTADVIDLGHHAADIGADAVLVVNPYYAMLNQDALFHHYQMIAKAVPLPILLYNFPALTGQNLGVDFVKRVAMSCPNVVGLKDTVETIGHTRQVLNEVKAVRPDFVVFSGYDEYLLDNLILGGDGGIPATVNFAADICCGIYRAFGDRDFETIVALQRRLAKLSPIFNLDSPFFGVVKEAIRLTGSDISTAVLAPGMRPAPEITAKLTQALIDADVLPAA